MIVFRGGHQAKDINQVVSHPNLLTFPWRSNPFFPTTSILLSCSTTSTTASYPPFTLPGTNSSHLKIDGWKSTVPLKWPLFRGYVSFRGCISTFKAANLLPNLQTGHPPLKGDLGEGTDNLLEPPWWKRGDSIGIPNNGNPLMVPSGKQT